MSETEADVELNLAKPTAVVTGLVIMSICVSLSVALAGWVFRHRKSPVVKAKQPEFLIILCFGTILLELTILPAGMNDTHPIEIDRACMAVVWLQRLGEMFIYTSLFLKLWRVNQIFKAGGSFRRKAAPLKRALCLFTIFLALNIFLLITGTVVDPMVWVRESIGDDNSVGYCYRDGVGTAMDSLAGFLNFVALIILCVQAHRAWDVSSDFSEARGVAFALFSLVQMSIIAYPMFALVEMSNVTAKYVLLVLFTTMINLSLLLFILGPLVTHQRNFERDGGIGRLRVSCETHHEGETTESSNDTNVASYALQGAKRRIAELELQVKALTGSGVNKCENQSDFSSLTSSGLQNPSVFSALQDARDISDLEFQVENIAEAEATSA